MVRFVRPVSWSFPNYLARLPDYYYKHRQDLKKTSTRVHDIGQDTEYYDLKYNTIKHKV